MKLRFTAETHFDRWCKNQAHRLLHRSGSNKNAQNAISFFCDC